MDWKHCTVKEGNRKARTMLTESPSDDFECQRINFGKCFLKHSLCLLYGGTSKDG
jgi:hypothetical protein